ncbi:arylsulfatase [Mycolicibacterium wolinskyi]|uniref:Arylsulfatase n=1 Tax=Mycolicibacterium wolinskyi TaxID=59750 RepID=A0A1X2F912_9MYCO|nr:MULTISPECIES: arylsulfatase [Mycolicibacterium]MCV7286324.1 arylsulfatase [Mycolicibacterium wolinskyi]MCV7293304.1 arylsulfatase [Mycolicibacterium goodii]ORX14930.1 arylsulfatase [Mycolicibacterium wolinskyi]
MVEFDGTVCEDIRDSVPDWAPYRGATAPAGAPNVLYLLWDDTGIATWDCYGGLVEMPNMSRIADRGIRLTQFHTTALCSPTRASLLTGRNPTSVGVASVLNLADGYPGHNGRIPAETALMSEVLAERGWSTYAVGKWHLTPLEDCHAAGSRRYWPLNRGFDRFYGFLDGMTDQWYPSLVRDNQPIDPPSTPEQGYHLSKDLADNAIGFLRDHRAAAPDKPWFMYLCPGAGHSPHQVFPEWADKYRGRFDMGYEQYRELALANQKKLGLVPPETELSPMNPYAGATSPDGIPWPEHENVRPWDSLSDDDKRVSCRMAEVFAGFLSYTDAQIGRVLDYLEDTGQLDNTIVVIMSDNGASGEGGPMGAIDESVPMFGSADTTREGLRLYDELGGPATQLNYSNGWAMAFNTPYKLFKRYASHEGGIADPCVISWPAGLSPRGAVRDHYAHVSDVTPTVYDLLGITDVGEVKGIAQRPLEGVSFAAALHDPAGGTVKDTQFYSMMGTRGIWHDGWFANTVHPPTCAGPRGWSQFDQDRWELFRIEADRSQIHDLAAEHPDKLAELKALWHEKAVEYQAFPLSDLSTGELIGRGAATAAAPSPRVVYYAGTPAGHTSFRGLVRGRSFVVTAVVTVESDAAAGVLFSQGNRSGGQVLFLQGTRLRYVCNVGGVERAVTSDEPITVGRHVFRAEFTRTGSIDGTFGMIGDVVLSVDDRVVGAAEGVAINGLDIMQTVSAGRSVVYSVSSVFDSPYPLTGGVLDHVTVDFAGDAAGAGGVLDVAFQRD